MERQVENRLIPLQRLVEGLHLSQTSYDTIHQKAHPRRDKLYGNVETLYSLYTSRS